MADSGNHPDPHSRIRLNDPKAMRALAHPLRISLLAELRVRGPQSVGMLSELLDEAPGSISYHVGKLAEFGFVEEAPELARDRRERWWRAAHASTSWSVSEEGQDPERQLASGALRRIIARRLLQTYEAYLDIEPTLEPGWVNASTTGDAFLHLTVEQMQELQGELDGLFDRWEATGAALSAKDGAETTVFTYQLYRRP